MARDRKDIARTAEVPKTATNRAVISDGSALDRTPVHPALIQLIRLLARQAVAEDIAAQRSTTDQGD